MAYVDEVLADAPLAWWQGDEATGATSLEDYGSGTDADMTVTNPGEILFGEAGPAGLRAMRFGSTGGPANYASTATTPAKLQLATYTVEALVKVPSGVATPGTIFCERTGEGDIRYALHLSNAGFTGVGAGLYPFAGQAVFFNTWQYRIAPSPISQDDWHHLLYTHNGSQIELFVDGASVGTAAASAPPSGTLALQIGRRWDNAGAEYFNGWIAQVAIYSGVLSGARVLAHRNAALGPGPTVGATSVLLGAIAGDRLPEASAVLSARVRRGPSVVMSAYAVHAGGSFLGVYSQAEVDALPVTVTRDHWINSDIEGQQVQQSATFVDSSKVLALREPVVGATDGLYRLEIGDNEHPLSLTDGAEETFYLDKDGHLHARSLNFGEGASLTQEGVELDIQDEFFGRPALKSSFEVTPTDTGSTGISWGTPAVGDARLVSVYWEGAATLTSAGGLTIARQQSVSRTIGVTTVTSHLAVLYDEGSVASPTTDTLVWNVQAQRINIHAELWANVAVSSAKMDETTQYASVSTVPNTGPSLSPGDRPLLAFAAVGGYTGTSKSYSLTDGFTTEHIAQPQFGIQVVSGWKVHTPSGGLDTGLNVAMNPWIATMLTLKPRVATIASSATGRALVFAALRGDTDPSLYVVGPNGGPIELGHGGVAARTTALSVTNSAALTEVLSTTIPAGALQEGTMFGLKLFGNVNNRSALNDTLEWRISINGVTLITHSVAPPNSTVQNNEGYHWEAMLQVRSHGASGVIAGTSHITTTMATNQNRFQSGDTATLDTRQALTIAVQMKWSVADSGNTFRVHHALIQRVFN